MAESKDILESTGVFNAEELEMISNCLTDNARRDIALLCYSPKFLAWVKESVCPDDRTEKEIFWRSYFSDEKHHKGLREPGKEEELGWYQLRVARNNVGKHRYGNLQDQLKRICAAA